MWGGVVSKTLKDFLYYHEDGPPEITIYNGDCLEILPLLPKVDLVVTDPPYEVWAKNCRLAGDRAYLKDITTAAIDKGFDEKILTKFNNWFCFCSRKQLLKILEIAHAGGGNWMLLTWNKTNPTPLTNNNYLPDTEYIVHKYESGRLFGEYRDKSRFIVYPVEQNGFDHPTVKPLRVINKLFKLGSKESETILDPFLGSGTTLVACKELKRNGIGIEISPKYCEVAKQRLQNTIVPFL